MRWSCRILLLLSLCAGGRAARGGPAPDELPEGYVAEVLSNGLRVSVVADPAMTVVATQVWYHVGSANEEPRSRGLAHLFEHLMFGGTAHHGSRDYSDLHHHRGGDENAYTTPDETVYVSEVPPGPPGEVLEFEADRMRGLVVDEANLENEKRIVTEELRLSTENDPFSRLFAVAQRALLGEHPYALDPNGSKEDVAAATVDSCRAFYDDYYRPGNAHVIVVGPVDRDATLGELRRMFGSIPAGGRRPADVPPLVDWPFPPLVRLAEDIPPVEIAVLGFPLPPTATEDGWALLVLDQLLTGGAVDPVEDELVGRRGKAVAAGAELFQLRRGGAVVLYSASLPYRRERTAFRLLEQTRRQLSRLDWITEESVTAAKRALERQELEAVFYPASRAEELGRAQWWLGDERLAFERARRIAAVSRADVAEVWTKYVGTPEPVRIHIRPEHVPLLVRLFGWLYPLVRG